ncbi:MAG: hypothetical protein IJV83_05270, partial [Clostridia bacterium]|nr:hypothetical protein [Clostridia bacterium]
MKKQKKSNKIYFVLILLTILFGTLFAYAFATYLGSNDRVVVRTEISYLILTLLIVLPFVLLFLLIAAWGGGKEVEIGSVDIGNLQVPANVEVKGGIAVTGKQTESAEKAEEEEEGRSRFYMLCELDANRAKFQKTTYDESITLKRFCEEFRNFACNK